MSTPLLARWEEDFESSKWVKQYPSAWVHFTDLPKLGINPRKTHRDPYGIYFYPCKWLYENYSGFQYGISKDYFFICRLRLTTKGINLGRMTLNQAKRISQNNGWWEFLNKALTTDQPEQYFANNPNIPLKTIRRGTIGAIFWATVDALANAPEVFDTVARKWTSLLKGVDYVYDPGRGYISNGELYQICVMNPKIITTIHFGTNKPKFDANFRKLALEITKRYNGTYTIKHGIVTAKFEINEAPFTIIFNSIHNIEIIYYSKGMQAKKKFYYEPDYWDRSIDTKIRILTYTIDYLAKSASTSKVDYWPITAIEKIATSVFPKPTGRSGTDINGLPYFYYQPQSMVNSHTWINIVKLSATTVTVEFYLGIKTNYLDIELRFKTKYKHPKNENDVIKSIAAKLKKAILDNEAIKSGDLHPFGILRYARINPIIPDKRFSEASYKIFQEEDTVE